MLSQLNCRQPRVAIVGFGLIGRLIAVLLSQRCQLSLYDANGFAGKGSAGMVAAGMLGPISESHLLTHQQVQQGLNSIDIWRRVLSIVDAEEALHLNGCLVLAHAQDRASLAQFIKHLKIPRDSVSLLAPEQFLMLEPELNPELARQAVFLKEEGHINTTAFFEASLRYVRATSAEFHGQALDSSDIEQIKLAYDVVIDCRGLGAKTCLPGLRGVRGEIVQLHAPEVTLRRPIRLMHPRHPIYIVPRPDKRYLVGATEIESEDLRPPSVRSTMELLSAAYSIHPAFAEASIEDLKQGLRPCFPSGQPSLDIRDNYLSINGFYRHGYLLGPAIAQQVVAWVETKGGVNAASVAEVNHV